MAGTVAAALVAALCLSAGPVPPDPGASAAASTPTTATTATTATVVTPHFTLRWQHSIEKTAWEEDYVVAGDWLLLSGARIHGSGAGMEPPPDAFLQGGVWHYRVPDPWRRSLVLARSEFVRDYELCLDGAGCQPLERWIAVSAGTTTLRACGRPARPQSPTSGQQLAVRAGTG